MRSPRQQVRRGLDVLTSPVGSLLRITGPAVPVALTFDDGPDPEVTPALLDGLADLGVRATFFVLVSRARLYPDVLGATVRAGHEIALHGADHRRLTQMSVPEAVTHVRAGLDELAGLAARPVRWFRPPYGAHGPRLWFAARRMGLEVVLWGPSLHDWSPGTPKQRWERARAQAGDIVLAHDGIADERDGVSGAAPVGLDRAAWALEVVGRYHAAGLQVASLGEAVAAGRAVRGARWTR